MKKRSILICGILLVVILALAVGLYFLIVSLLPETYSSAKKECKKALAKDQVQLEEVAMDTLKSSRNKSGQYKTYFYVSDPEERIVTFHIDGQETSGYQEWLLVYSESGMLYGQSQELHKKNSDGILKAERINEHWWYCWVDYGSTDRSYQ